MLIAYDELSFCGRSLVFKVYETANREGKDRRLKKHLLETLSNERFELWTERAF